MSQITRRAFIRRSSAALCTCLSWSTVRGSCTAERSSSIRFTMDLRCSSIGVRADQQTAIRLAARHGFESVTPHPEYLSGLSDAERATLLAELQDRGLVWGAAGLPVDFRHDGAKFEEDLQRLPKLARAMQQAGVTRVGTWLTPGHDELTYVANFRQHAKRLRACADIFLDHGLRLGLEYVGPKTSRSARRHSFVHTMAETKDLIAEIDRNNVGFVLDSWHWYTAHESVTDLRTLTNQDIIACDLNDAPAGIPIDEQIDNRRELPAATGVIDVRAFLGVLKEIGYDGPVRAEPFNRTLNGKEDDAAVAATAQAMRAAFALVANKAK